ncbi:hypothetical protein PLESTB_000157200 [Pleodorina starrii]|uniref:Uncharacterized protein n=1 Tax=Pleodorina starrii TaxID=330485 RepID=A0A9W6EXF1_9CHLO|nr:hypothetical protein PLESTB_000157200 [Pleodorina starrii]GLC72597.1 hypothetical protein PLESTF_001268600 [Pleodorina starrii]
MLLNIGGKFHWSSVVVSVEAEMPRRRRPDTSSIAGGSHGVTGQGQAACFGSSPGALPGSSPSGLSSALMLFSRTSLSALPKLRSKAVVSWVEARASVKQNLLLDLGSTSHDFDGTRALETLLRAANRGSRGLRTLRLIWPDGAGGQDSYEMLGRLRGLEELHVNGLQQGFLGGTMPYLSGLSGLTRLSFTPKTFQFPVSVPSLPSNLRVLHLSNLWVSRLPLVSSAAPHLRELHLLQCHLMDGLLAALEGAPSLEELRMDGSRLTGPREETLAWEAASCPWPACPALRKLALADCALRALPAGVLRAFPGLELLDLSNNQDLGGAVGVPNAAAAAACLPPELTQLGSLTEVRLAKCGLTAVPAALLNVPSLTALDLYHNSLSSLPLAPAPAAPPPPLGSPAKAMQPTLAQAGAGPGPSSAVTGAGAGQALRLPQSPVNGVWAAAAAAAAVPARRSTAAAVPGGGGGGGGGFALFAERLVKLNIGMNRFTVWPQGLMACTSLRELVVGELLVARAPEGELERCAAALPGLTRLEVRGDSFEPRAVRNLMALQRAAAARGGRPRVEVTGA